jgi:galacturan 1,4-alpha-galacturonidase
MRFQVSSLLTLTAAALSAANPTWSVAQEFDHKSGKNSKDHTSTRPSIKCHPKSPHNPVPSHPVRNKVCYVKSHGDGQDDSPYILDAIHDCNNGGHVVFRETSKYVIGTALDLTFLKHIDIGMSRGFLVR